jgi:hypothetical protein
MKSSAFLILWQHNRKISAGTDRGVYVNLGSDTPEKKVQRLDNREWKDHKKHGKPVKPPVDIETLPAGKYRLVS